MHWQYNIRGKKTVKNTVFRFEIYPTLIPDYALNLYYANTTRLKPYPDHRLRHRDFHSSGNRVKKLFSKALLQCGHRTQMGSAHHFPSHDRSIALPALHVKEQEEESTIHQVSACYRNTYFSGFMPSRQSILFVLSLVFITGFFLLPRNKEWANTLISYWRGFQNQKNSPDTESRMQRRFGNNYIYSRNIADSLTKRSQHTNNLVLMPPTNYFKKMGMDYHVPEPAVFYYYTGIKTTWANSKDAINANWLVHVRDGKIVLESVSDKKSLQDTIDHFKKLGVSL